MLCFDNDELDSRINTSYNASKQYQDLIKCNHKEMQQSMEVDKNEQLSVINVNLMTL